MQHCSARLSRACNGRPANLLKLQCFISHVRTENHGVGGSIPPLGTSGCLIRRKAELVAAVRGGRWSLEGARERYASTIDEFLSWQTTLDPHGLPGQAGRQNPPLQFLLL